jgi:hypothetical protein
LLPALAWLRLSGKQPNKEDPAMSKSLLALAAGVVLYSVGFSEAVKAADRDLPRRARAERYRAVEPYCGCCGCLNVTYDRHRELRTTFGTHFDPRNYDQTEPHYYFGPVRAYPQYWTERGGYELHY